MSESTFSSFLLPASDAPAANYAARTVVKHNLSPPVDIYELTSRYADVGEEDWPESECDALLVGLGTSQPKAFLRQSAPPRRKRFSLAHELGHLRMFWHIGVLGCTPASDELDEIPEDGSFGLSQLLSSSQMREQEVQATQFASLVLLPDRWFRKRLGGASFADAINALDGADVSAWACMRRLESALKPGFLFSFTDPVKQRLFRSHGTRVPDGVREGDFSQARRSSLASGLARIGGREVQWYRFSNSVEFTPSLEKRTATELLRAAIGALVPGTDDREKLLQSVNGIVGAALSTIPMTSRSEVYSTLRYRCESRYPELTSCQEFEEYLKKKTFRHCEKVGL